MTALDSALTLAQENKGKTVDFYRLFLRSQLLVPILDTPESKAARPTATKGRFKFRIKLLQKRRILMVFDTTDRLKTAFKAGTSYIKIGARPLLGAISSGLYILLNSGTPHAKMFLPKELAWLKKVFAERKKA